jgi:hypothetical protein
MTRIILTIALAALALALFALPARTAAQQKEGKKLFHVVSLKFKQDAAKSQIKAVEDAFVGLKEKVPGIVGLTWGINVSPEKHDKGFTHCFVLCFDTEKARDDYLVHPDHKAFGKVLGPVLADVFVIDFWGDVQHGEQRRAAAE